MGEGRGLGANHDHLNSFRPSESLIKLRIQNRINVLKMFILNETTNSLYVAGTLTITTMHEINGVVLADKAQYNICLANVD